MASKTRDVQLSTGKLTVLCQATKLYYLYLGPKKGEKWFPERLA